ncbi:MAG TPA: lysophospholipid acyltransferase family protein [Polyangiaceae bacterium]|jgi:1-acyl-sn-glycerol-3-phosphate acyltransferase
MPPRTKSLTLSLQNIYETYSICWPTVLEALAGRVKMDVCDRRLAHWASEIARHCAYELEVIGRQNLGDHSEAFLVMSNHQSLYDVPVLFHVLGANLRMITKTELFKVPIFGPAMAAAGFIEIDRSNRERAMASLEEARRKIAGGLNVWIAPEGTRSKNGALLPFKKGGFNLALEAGLRILPITLDGTRDILPAKGARSVKAVHVRVILHPPLDARAYAARGLKEGRDALMKDVRTALERGL